MLTCRIRRTVTIAALEKRRRPSEDTNGDETVEFDGAAGRVSALRRGWRETTGIHAARGGAGLDIRRFVRRGFCLCGTPGRSDGFRFDPHRRAFNQHPARVRA